MPWMPGKSRSIIGVLNSLPVSNVRNAAWKFPSATISAWLFGPLCAWRFIACILVFLGLRQKQALFARLCVSISLIQLSRFSQLRKSYLINVQVDADYE